MHNYYQNVDVWCYEHTKKMKSAIEVESGIENER